jgi:hypothetical protein
MLFDEWENAWSPMVTYIWPKYCKKPIAYLHGTNAQAGLFPSANFFYLSDKIPCTVSVTAVGNAVYG